MHLYINYDSITWASTISIKSTKLFVKLKYAARIILYADIKTPAKPLLRKATVKHLMFTNLLCNRSLFLCKELKYQVFLEYSNAASLPSVTGILHVSPKLLLTL